MCLVQFYKKLDDHRGVAENFAVDDCYEIILECFVKQEFIDIWSVN